MKITKDEARILGIALSEAKYEMVREKSDSLQLIKALNDLEERLLEAGRDQRRTGRTSMDDFSDCLKRYSTPKQHA